MNNEKFRESPGGRKYANFSFGSLTIRKFLNSPGGSAASFSIAEGFSEIPESPRGKENKVFAEIASGNQKSRLRLLEGS